MKDMTVNGAESHLQNGNTQAQSNQISNAAANVESEAVEKSEQNDRGSAQIDSKVKRFEENSSKKEPEETAIEKEWKEIKK